MMTSADNTFFMLYLLNIMGVMDGLAFVPPPRMQTVVPPEVAYPVRLIPAAPGIQVPVSTVVQPEIAAAVAETNRAFIPPPPPQQTYEPPEYSATMADTPTYSNTYLKYIFGSITAFALYFLLGDAVNQTTKNIYKRSK